MKKNLLVIGFGWLGQHYVAQSPNKYNVVFGMKRSNISMYDFPASVEIISLDLFQNSNALLRITSLVSHATHILIALPPSSAPDQKSFYDFFKAVADIVKDFSGRIVLISSIGAALFKETNRSVSLKQVEQLFANYKNTTVIRMGGLVGYDRHPVLSLAKTKNIVNGDDFIQLISVEDCIAVIDFAFEKGRSIPKLLTAVAPNKSSKFEYYTESARIFEVDSPTFVFEGCNDLYYIFENRIEDYGYSWVNPELKRPNV